MKNRELLKTSKPIFALIAILTIFAIMETTMSISPFTLLTASAILIGVSITSTVLWITKLCKIAKA